MRSDNAGEARSRYLKFACGFENQRLQQENCPTLTQDLANKRNVSRTLLLFFLTMITIAGIVPFGLAQVSQMDAKAQSVNSGTLLSFEVASIKPNHSGGGMVQINNSPGRFKAVNVTAKMLIAFAYNIKGPELSGGPNWIDSERFDIDAKVNDTPEDLGEHAFEETGNRRRLMLQSLLADRFQLKITHQNKELAVYALIVGKNGPKFHESTTPAPDPAASSDRPRASEASARGPRVMMRVGELTMTEAPMSLLADALSGRLGRRVIDQTGLKGKYDLTLQWTPDEGQGAMAAITAGGPDGRLAGDSAQLPNAGPSIFTALEEQLGLKLDSQKSPVDTLVIEHIAQPSAD
jgi:uncharacterized protein (TIGR03435 family)